MPDLTFIDNMCKRRKIPDSNGLPVIRQRKRFFDFTLFRKGQVENCSFFFPSRRHRRRCGLLKLACKSHSSSPQPCLKRVMTRSSKIHGRGRKGKEVFFKHVLWMGMYCCAHDTKSHFFPHL